jgi:hypothetical protein
MPQPDKPKNWLDRAFKILSTTERASAAGMAGILGRQDPAQFFSEGKGYNELVDEMFPDMNPVMKRIVGFGAGVALDPLTYVPGSWIAKPLGGAAKAVAGTKAGKAIVGSKPAVGAMKLFGSKDLVRKTLFPEVEKAYSGAGGYLENLGQGLAKAQGVEDEMAVYFAQHGIDKETNDAVSQFLETLPRKKADDFRASRRAVDAARGPKSEQIYAMTALQKAGNDQRWAALLPEGKFEKIETGLKERMGVAEHMAHQLKRPVRNRARVKREMKLAGLDAKALSPDAFAKRYRKGTLIEKAERYGDDVYETWLPRRMGRSAAELAHAEAGADYVGKVVKLVGKPVGLGEALPAGYKLPTFQDPMGIVSKFFKAEGGRLMAIPAELESDVLKVIKGAADVDDISHGLLGVFDNLTNWWRTTTLFPFLPYHIRNVGGNWWNNHLAGGVRYNDYAKAGKFAKALRGGQLEPDDLTMLGDMLSRRVIHASPTAQEMGYLPTTFKEAILEGSWLPWKFVSEAKTFTPNRIGMWLSEVMDNNARMAHYFSRVRMGKSPQDAANSVLKYLGGKEMTDFETNVMRRVFPFWRWTKFNLPLQLEMLITKPGKFANLSKAMEAVEGWYGPQPVEKWMDDYMKQTNPLWLKTDSKTGHSTYFMLRSWIPANDLLMFEDAVDDVMSMLNPYIKEPLQQIFNRDLWLDRPISRYPQESLIDKLNPLGGEQGNFLGMVLNTRTIHLMKNIRILNELDRLNPFGAFGENRAHHVDDEEIWRWVGAFMARLNTYDPEKARQLWLREFKEKVHRLQTMSGYAARRGYVKESVRYRQILQKYTSEKRAEAQGL